MMQHILSRTTWLYLCSLLLASAVLAGCSSTPSRYRQKHDSAPAWYRDVAAIKEPVPRAEPHSRHGNPSSYVVRGKRYHVLKSSKGYHERGLASWYGSKFHGHRTSIGERYDVYGITAAHKTLPLPTYVRVTNLKNGRKLVVRVNDRGPFHGNRLIDLSFAAAKKLGITETGTAPVDIVALNTKPTPSATNSSRWYLQAGAFRDKDRASRFAETLRATYRLNVKLSPSSLNNKPIFRVRIGPLPSSKALKAVKRKLQRGHIAKTLLAINTH